MIFRWLVVRWQPANAYWGGQDHLTNSRYLSFESACHTAAVIQENEQGAVVTIVELPA